MPQTKRPYRFGIFAHFDICLNAIKQLMSEGYKDIEIYTPVPHHEFDTLIKRKPSPVRVFTLAGGLTGLLTGWLMTIGSTWLFPIVVGGKPIISIPPFAVVAYICTILFGTIATFIGFLSNARVPQIKVIEGYDERLSSDHFGVLVYSPPSETAKLEKFLKKNGAVAVNKSKELEDETD